MNNIKKDGTVLLNMDDSFFSYHKKIALKKIIEGCYFWNQNKFSMTN